MCIDWLENPEELDRAPRLVDGVGSLMFPLFRQQVEVAGSEVWGLDSPTCGPLSVFHAVESASQDRNE